MSSSWPLSRTVVTGSDGEPAPGAKVYFFEANTTTPRIVYQDPGLATPHAHPVVANGDGRWPRVYLPYGSYDEKVTRSNGVQLWHDSNIPNPEPTDPSESVDANALLQTGDVWWSPVAATRSGAVRLNGRTIGNASSGATERANADTENLFAFLWNALDNTLAPVSGGRGASAAADFAANKTITPPDARGVALAGLDSMGNVGIGRLTGVTVQTGNGNTPGSLLGAQTVTLAEGNLPSHAHTVGSLAIGAAGSHAHNVSGSTAAAGEHSHSGGTGTAGSHSHGFSRWNGTGISVQLPTGSATVVADDILTGDNTTSVGDHWHPIFADGNHAHSLTGATDAQGSHAHSISGSVAATGSGMAIGNVSLQLLGTWFIKL